jgi:hypothetical protein
MPETAQLLKLGLGSYIAHTTFDQAVDISLLDWLQLAHQRLFLPQNIRRLVRPIPALIAELKVKIIQDSSNNEPHLMICHAARD